MSLTADLGLGVLFVLAFGNGANDVGKSIVALMTDPETSTFRPRYSPLIWGGLFSGLGSVAAILISVRLFSAFAPQSFLQTAPGSSFILAAIVGAPRPSPSRGGSTTHRKWLRWEHSSC